jgi:hypothetical protein
VVAGALYEALAKLRLRYPDVGPEKKQELAAARAELMGETKPAARRAPKRPRPAAAAASARPVRAAAETASLPSTAVSGVATEES